MAYSGPALAGSGLTSLLDAVTEPLPPALSEPVADVGATVAPVVDPVLEPVSSPVDVATGVVEETTTLVDSTVSGGLGGVEGTVEDVLGPVRDPVGAPTEPGSASAVVPETETGSAASTVPAEPAAVGSDPPSVSSTTAQIEAVIPSPAARPANTPTFTAATVAAPRGTTPARGASRVAVTSPPSTGATPLAAAGEHVAAPDGPVRDAVSAPARPRPLSHDGSFDLGGLLPQQTPPAPLLAALLALLALVTPGPGGRRLHTAVALLRPADVHMRLVRPG